MLYQDGDKIVLEPHNFLILAMLAGVGLFVVGTFWFIAVTIAMYQMRQLVLSFH